ncbi:MAG: acyloxyacyl hydrolase [Bacteroidales bacterium]|nr:acyloxyacyl hydrolase [Bacteroidales bacterium]
MTINNRTTRFIAAIAALAMSMNARCYATVNDTTTYNNKPIFITARGEIGGRLAQVTDFFKGDNQHGVEMKNFNAVNIGIGWQTTGKKDWERIHDLPAFGVALYTARLDNAAEIGKPISLMGFYKGTMHRWGNHAIRYNIDLGLTFNWKPYDYETNRDNIVIGSPVTVHIGYGVEYEYTIANRLALAIGGTLTHFSNGSIRRPNKGANLASPHIRASYYLNEYQPRSVVKDFGRMKAHEMLFSVGYGRKHVDIDSWLYEGIDYKYINKPDYNAATIKVNYMRQYSHKAKYGGGLSLCYDDYLDTGIRVDQDGTIRKTGGRLKNQINIGVFASHEYLIGNLGILTDLGGYIYQPRAYKQFEESDPKKKTAVFERLGIKYYLPMNLFAGVNVYAHIAKADFVEWNIGYRLRWGEKIER